MVQDDLIMLDHLGDLGLAEMNGMMRTHTQDVIRLATLLGFRLSINSTQAAQFETDCRAYDLDPQMFIASSSGTFQFTPIGVFLLKICAKVHDIGKPFFRHSYSLERDLNREEYEIQKLHAHLTRIVIKSWILSDDLQFKSEQLVEFVADMAAGHQERFDGTGYPDGRSGSEIGLISRILAPLDATSAMMNPRPFKDPCNLDNCIKLLLDAADEQFDPELLNQIIGVLKTDPDAPSRVTSDTKPCERFSADYLKFIQFIDFSRLSLGPGDQKRISELKEVVRLALAHQRAIRHESVH